MQKSFRAISSTVLFWMAQAALPAMAADSRWDACTGKDHEAAIKACTALIEDRSIGADSRSIAYNNRATEYDHAGKYDAAIKDYSEAVKLNPKYANAYTNRGTAYYHKADYKHALADYEVAVKLKPKEAEAYHNRGRANFQVGNYDDAIRDYSETISLEQNSASSFYDRGLAYATKNDLDQAITDYDEAVRIDPTFAAAYDNRGNVYSRKGEFDRALKDHDMAINLGLKNAISFNNRGWAYANKGDYDKAIQDYDEAIKLDPKFTKAAVNREDALKRRGTGSPNVNPAPAPAPAPTPENDPRWIECRSDNADISIRGCSALIEDKKLPANLRADAYAARGFEYARKGDYERAIKDYSEAISLNPASAMAFYDRGIAHAERQDYDKALKDYDEAIRLNANYAKAYDNRGNVYHQKGDYDAALRDHNVAINLGLKNALSYYNRGLTFAAKGEYQRAVDDFDESIKIDPKFDQPVRARDDVIKKVDAAAANKQPPPANPAAAQNPASASSIKPQTRVALVVGNASYVSAGRLNNTLNDARDIAAALRRVGFDVISANDVTVAQFDDKVNEFMAKSRGADVALFYYAGHATQDGMTNYLLPVDAKLETATAMKRETVNARDIIDGMEATARINLVFLDACRNNLLSDRVRANMPRAANAGRGLAPMDVTGRDTLVVYSTAPRETAEDGSGEHSPFATALLNNIEAPGVEIETMLKKVTKAVLEATAQKQQPERLSRLVSEFYFKPVSQ